MVAGPRHKSETSSDDGTPHVIIGVKVRGLFPRRSQSVGFMQSEDRMSPSSGAFPGSSTMWHGRMGLVFEFEPIQGSYNASQ